MSYHHVGDPWSFFTATQQTPDLYQSDPAARAGEVGYTAPKWVPPKWPTAPAPVLPQTAPKPISFAGRFGLTPTQALIVAGAAVGLFLYWRKR